MLEFTTTKAPPSKEMELRCICSGKCNPKRFNDTHKKFQLNTTYYKEGKKLNTYYKEGKN
jgi:hypothetical protein